MLRNSRPSGDDDGVRSVQMRKPLETCDRVAVCASSRLFRPIVLMSLILYLLDKNKFQGLEPNPDSDGSEMIEPWLFVGVRVWCRCRSVGVVSLVRRGYVWNHINGSMSYQFT
jgi:hypothetical protein